MILRNKTRLLVLAAWAVLLGFGAYHGLRFANKVTFCHGWAEHYAQRATEIEAQPVDPAHAAEVRLAADQYRRIAQRYEEVAWRPWRPYPSYPLLPEFDGRR